MQVSRLLRAPARFHLHPLLLCGLPHLQLLYRKTKINAMRNDLDTLKSLGGKSAAPADYDPAVLETFANRMGGRDYWVTFTAPEFTTLCPKTGQPDFAVLTIRYVPGERLVESKSLKLYLFGFRNHGDFHEDVVNIIHDDLAKLLQPKYIEVVGKFAPRGGISIDPFVNSSNGEERWQRLAVSRFDSWNGVR